MRSYPLASLLLVAATACGSPTSSDEDVSGSAASDGTLTTSDGSSTGDPCPVGAEGCPCTPGGGCDAELVCSAEDVCEVAPPTCTIGDLGCACSEGGACLGDWVCSPESGLCEVAVSETCGDGVVDELEECDEGASGNGDAAPATCTSSCKLPVCGDGLVGPGEACDGGEACTPGCSLATCGNGQLDPGEECEPAVEEDPECLASCLDGRKLIFVTSVHYKGGEIGGVQGADEKCQALAESAGRAGIFRAWLASSAEDAPAVRFIWHDLPYVDAAGVVLAGGWEDVDRPPLLNEHALPAQESSIPCGSTLHNAWSAGLYGPKVADDLEYDCGDFHDVDSLGAMAQLSGDGSVTINATCWKISCAGSAPLICVEQ